MNKEQALLILKDMLGDYKDNNFMKDRQALEYAIKELERTAPEVPVQEQYVININSSSVSNEINHKIVQKFLNQQDNNLLFDHRI